ncbi:MAG TPA: aldo/keto reductase [Paludibaculum sp.]|jgi:aryl-alcohol dehydrogenase-like predicted oxidoreductase
MERRSFLKSTIAGTAVAAALDAKTTLPRRLYKDGVKLSIIGFGGIVVMGHEQAEADRIVASVVDRSVNYFDVAPSYGDGEAEIKLGPALAPHRKDVFLACKTGKRDGKGAQAELERSLVRLKTDHFDLYQFHGITSMKDVDQITGPGGAGELFLKAREQGKVRYLGVSAHSAEAALALMDRFPLDSILFPVNFVCWEQGKFGPQILEKAKSKGMARMALKSMAHTNWAAGDVRKYKYCWYRPVDDPAKAREVVRFTLSQDITAAIPPGDNALFEMAMSEAASFRPLTTNESKALLASTAGVEPLFRA